MSLIENLFSRSPFDLLQKHMDKVLVCVEKVTPLYEAYIQRDVEKTTEIAAEISKLEHSADLTKNEIRNNLNRGILLSIRRVDLLDILSLQDSLADKAEDIGILMTLKNMKAVKNIEKDFETFLQKNIEAVHLVGQMISDLPKLMEYTFGGSEAKKIRQQAYDVSCLEHEVDIIQYTLLKKLYNMDKPLEYTCFNLWINIIKTIASLSNLSEKLANKLSMLLENN